MTPAEQCEKVPVEASRSGRALAWEDLVGVLDALDPVLRADLLTALFDVVLES